MLLTNGGAEAIALVAAELGRGWVDEPEFSLYRRHLPVLDPDGPAFRSDPHNPTGALAAPDEHAGGLGRGLLPVGHRPLEPQPPPGLDSTARRSSWSAR